MRYKAKPLVIFIFLLLLIKSVYPEEKRPFKPGFSIKLMSGRGFVAIGDVNKCIESVNNNEVFEYWRKHDPNSIAGEIKTLDNWVYDWEAEMRIDLSPRFSVGIAASAPFHRSNESSLSFALMEERDLIPQITAMYYRPEIKLSIPVKLNFYCSLLHGTRFNAFLNAGVGYYPGKISEYNKFVITSPSSGYSWWLSDNWEVNGKFPFGFHGGFGLEYRLIKNLSLVIDFLGKYIRISNLKGRHEHKDSHGTYIEEKGTLYYFTMWQLGIGARYANLEVWEKPRDKGGVLRGEADIKKAVLDLSGFSLRVGVRINLF
jgi:hypothetical protein